MYDYEDKLTNKLERIRDDLKYYKQMTPEEYVTYRVIKKIKIYFLFAKTNKRWYTVIAVLSIIAGISIPLLLNFNPPYAKEFATALTLPTGGLISLEAGVFNFRETFKNYKKSEDQLTNELMLFQTGSEPYDLKQSSGEEGLIYRLFVSRVESIILRERDDTVEKMTRISLENMKTAK